MDMIGNALCDERQKRKLEFADVEQATGIRAVYLQALEQGNYELLPGEVYIKGFIRNYGNYLGLDGAHLVHLYNEASGSGTGPATAPPSVAVKPVPVKKKSDSLPRKYFGMKSLNSLVIVFIVLLSLWGLYIWQKPSAPGATEQARNSVPATSKPGALPVTNPPVRPSSGSPSVGTRPLVLVARYSDRCWTSVIADGKNLYEGIPKVNETLTWEADRQIIVNFGNAAAVDLLFNGQPVGKIGGPGDVVVRTFSLPAASGSSAPNAVTAPAAPVAPTAAPNSSGSRP